MNRSKGLFQNGATGRAVKTVGGDVVVYGLIGLALGSAVGGFFGYQKLRRRTQFREQLTTNSALDLSALYQDEDAVEAFADLMTYRAHSPESYDTALYCGDRILRLYAKLRQNLQDPNAVVEDIPHQIGEQLVQLQRAMLAIGSVVSEKHGYMERQYEDSARQVLRRFSNVSYNASADVRDRKVRPIPTVSASPSATPRKTSTPVASPPQSPIGKSPIRSQAQETTFKKN